MVAWVPGVAYCCVAFMGYIKYSWVRGKHTVQYPELTHVIHTEINYLPGPRAGLQSLSTRLWSTHRLAKHWNWLQKVQGRVQLAQQQMNGQNGCLDRLTIPRVILIHTWSDGRGRFFSKVDEAALTVRRAAIQMVRDRSRSLTTKKSLHQSEK